MAGQGVNGIAVAAAGAGALLVWSGLKGSRVTDNLRSLLAGYQPRTANTSPISGVQTASGPGTASPTAGSWTHGGLMGLWIMAGGSQATANNAACHAIQESSGNASVTSPNPDGGTNVGLWQLDTKGKGAGYTIGQLQNPVTNARVTVKATGGGRDWSAWATPGC